MEVTPSSLVLLTVDIQSTQQAFHIFSK